jgi:hypothetical protein
MSHQHRLAIAGLHSPLPVSNISSPSMRSPSSGILDTWIFIIKKHASTQSIILFPVTLKVKGEEAQNCVISTT